MAGWTGIEPATSGLTGQRSNRSELPPQEKRKRNDHSDLSPERLNQPEMKITIFLKNMASLPVSSPSVSASQKEAKNAGICYIYTQKNRDQGKEGTPLSG